MRQNDNHRDAINRLATLSDDMSTVLEYVAFLEIENQELREYREKYDKLLTESINHGQAMMGHLLTATLEGHLK